MADIKQKLQIEKIRKKLSDAYKKDKIDFGFTNCVKIELQELVANEEGLIRGRIIRKYIPNSEVQILDTKPSKRNSESQKESLGRSEKKIKR